MGTPTIIVAARTDADANLLTSDIDPRDASSQEKNREKDFLRKLCRTRY
jgi:isocitrate lyase